MERREREKIPAWVSDCRATSCCPDASQGLHPPCLWPVVTLTIAVPPDQAGHQPVPGPCDGAAGQCAEWKGLSHSENQVTLTQETPPRAPTCLLGSEGSFPILLSAQLASGTFKERYFEAYVSRCSCLFPPIHGWKVLEAQEFTYKTRERIW